MLTVIHRSLRLGLFVALIGIARPTTPDRTAVCAAEGDDEQGFVPLFDGRTLEGWEGDLKLWKAENGMIVGDSPGIRHNEFLATRKRYSDFELRLEFKLRGGSGNSGIQFRSRRVPESHEVSGYQADIGEKYWGCLYDESRRKKVLAQAPAELQAALKMDDWNRYTIRAVGNRITLYLNGLKTVEYTESDETIAQSGIIALQVHSGGPLRVEFRNLRIRELGRKAAETEKAGNEAS
jgi:hypothetical protein